MDKAMATLTAKGWLNLNLRILGRVKNGIKERPLEGWKELISEIIIDPKLEEALEGIEEYSHIIVVFWLDKIDRNTQLQLKRHPRRRKDLPLIGIFATRTPRRPNPLGITAVELLGRQKNVLKVKGLDALDGTPVIDIKPISLPHDLVENLRLPEWAKTHKKDKKLP